MWRRALAFSIDLVPLLVLAAIENAVGIADSALIGLLNFAFLLTYFAGMNYQFGGTWGKRAVGLRVALPSSPDVPFKLIVRALVKVLCLFPPMATLYGLVAIWRTDGRSLADFASGSTVVEASSLDPPTRTSLSGRIAATIVILVAPWVVLAVLVMACFGTMAALE